MRTLIGIARLTLYGFMCVIGIPLQFLVLCVTRGRASFVLPQLFSWISCRLFSMSLTVIGKPARNHNILFLCNHLSSLDIPVIGQYLWGAFVAKDDVARWPVFGVLAKLQQTLFISRNPRRAGEGREKLLAQLDRARPMILFPEGTSGRGDIVLPFKSTLFDVFLDERIKSTLIIQPMTLRLDQVDGQDITPANLPLMDMYALYADMDFMPHLWTFAKSKGARLTLIFHDPIDFRAFSDRKALAQAAQMACASALAPAKDCA